MYSRVGVTAITCHISNDPDAFGYSSVQPGVPRHNVAARLTDNRSDGRSRRNCATKIEPICSADMPTFDPETTLRVSVFAGLRHRPSGVTVGEFSDIGSRVQSFGTVMTFGGAGAAVAGDGEAVNVAGGIGLAGRGEGVGEGVAGACATSAEMRKTCVRIITPPSRLSSFQGAPILPAREMRSTLRAASPTPRRAPCRLSENGVYSDPNSTTILLSPGNMFPASSRLVSELSVY